jgi:hypothetical protein
MLRTSVAQCSRALSTLLSQAARRPRTLGAAAALLAYGVTEYLILPGGTDPFSSHIFTGLGTDPSAFMWALNWWPYAVTHGVNPFVTNSLWAPQAVNLAWNTSIPSLAFIAWPLTATAGAIVSFNVITILAPVTAALAAYYLCYELTSHVGASMFGGWLFGFSAYELAQARGHLNLEVTAAIPLLVLLAILRFHGRIPRWAYVIVTGLLLAVEFGISLEIFAVATFFGCGALLVAFAFVPQSRPRLGSLARELLLAYAGSAVLIAPYIGYLVAGASQQPSVPEPPLVFSTDLLNFLLPTSVTALGGHLALPLTTLFTGNFVEEDAYLGVPLVLILAFFAGSRYRDPWARVLTVVLGVLLVSTLGPNLHILGHISILLPWDAAARLPLLRAALPSRFPLYISLLSATIASLWVVAPRRKHLLVALMAVITIVALWPAPVAVTPVRVPAWISSHSYTALFRRQATLVLLPYASLGDSMLWQAMSGLYFRMAGSNTASVPRSFAKLPAVAMFFGAPLVPNYGSVILRFCQKHHVVAIVVDRSLAPQWSTRLATLGWRTQRLGTSSVFWVPPSDG